MARLKQQHRNQVLRVSGRERGEKGREEEGREGRIYKVRKERMGRVRNGWREGEREREGMMKK